MAGGLCSGRWLADWAARGVRESEAFGSALKREGRIRMMMGACPRDGTSSAVSPVCRVVY